MIDPNGFTGSDLTLLNSAYRHGRVSHSWGRAQFVANDFSHYLAIWDNVAAADRPPYLSIVRFRRTGTYALVKGGKIVASDKRLATLLPVLAVAGRADEPVSEQSEGPQLH